LSAPTLSRLELDGEYDLNRKQELASLFEALDADAPIEIDLSRVTYLDSTVLHELAALRLRCHREITLVGANANLRRVFHVTNFDELFHIIELN
jgi:anti-anti-sigma factor